MNGKFADVIFSGGLIDGSEITSGTCYPVPGGGGLASGNVNSGHVASGSVPGFFGPTRAIQSGTVGSFDFGSGAVMAGQIGSGAVRSGNIASGSISANHTVSGTIYGVPTGGALASGQVQSGHVGSGAIQGQLGATFHIASGTIGEMDIGSGQITRYRLAAGSIYEFHINNAEVVAGKLGSGAVVSGNIASGQVGHEHLASGNVFGTWVNDGIEDAAPNIKSGSIGWQNIGSGALRTNNLASGIIKSGHIAIANAPDGTKFFRDDFTWNAPTASLASGTQIIPGQVIQWFNTVELISGQRAVMWASGGYPRIKRADPRSGQYTPVVGVCLSGAISGSACAVVINGPVGWAASGMMASGFHGDPVFAGSGGTIIMASGTAAGGAMSGAGIRQLSGMVALTVGTIHSGMVFVNPNNIVVNQSGAIVSRRGFIL